MTGLMISPAKAANTVNIVMPVSETDFDPCSNENVYLAGSAHFVANLTQNDNKIHITGEANEQLEGTGTSSGAFYRANATAHVDFNLDVDPAAQAAEATILSTGQLLGKGDVPNANIQLHIHVTVNNADGSVSAFIESVRLTCN
jgi:hypothetical protein